MPCEYQFDVELDDGTSVSPALRVEAKQSQSELAGAQLAILPVSIGRCPELTCALLAV